MKDIRLLLGVILMLILICFAFALDQPTTDTTEVEESDPVFVITKDDTKVYKELVPDAPIIYRLKKGDTLTIKEGDSLIMLGKSDHWAVIQIKDCYEEIPGK